MQNNYRAYLSERDAYNFELSKVRLLIKNLKLDVKELLQKSGAVHVTLQVISEFVPDFPFSLFAFHKPENYRDFVNRGTIPDLLRDFTKTPYYEVISKAIERNTLENKIVGAIVRRNSFKDGLLVHNGDPDVLTCAGLLDLSHFCFQTKVGKFYLCQFKDVVNLLVNLFNIK